MKFLEITTKFERTDSGKSWKKEPYKTRERVIDQRRYDLVTDEGTAKCFRRAGSYERLERSYTHHGYIVTKATTINPSKDDKRVRKFEPLGYDVTHRITHKKTGNAAYTKIDTETAGEKVHRVVSGYLPDRIVAIPTARAARLGYKVEKVENI